MQSVKMSAVKLPAVKLPGPQIHENTCSELFMNYSISTSMCFIHIISVADVVVCNVVAGKAVLIIIMFLFPITLIGGP